MHGNGDTSSLGKNIIPGILLSTQTRAASNEYVLHSACSPITDRCAVALSNHMIQVYENDVPCGEYVHFKEVTGLKFSYIEPSLLYSSSLDGTINVWDVRIISRAPVQTFCEKSDGVGKPITCFDYCLGEELICGGTELIREDSFLIFWDRRTSAEALGGYWNSHTDEITQVHFHPDTNTRMASSSVDGLINIFNLEERKEDDALMFTLNVGSAVNTFHWRDRCNLLCTTTTEEFQHWSIVGASPSVLMSKEDLTKHNQLQIDYLIDSIQIGDRWFLAGGSYMGAVQLWSSNDDGLSEVCCLLKGHSDTVRTVSYCPKRHIFITGGEDGRVCRWKIEPPR